MKRNLLMLLACVSVLWSWASTIDYTVDKANGNLYRGNDANQSWNSTWKSNATPQLQFGCGVNNMNWADNNVQLMTGTAGSATYTITAPDGYAIKEYTFNFANNGHSAALTLTMDDGKEYTTSSSPQTISASGLNAYSVSFTLAGENGKGVVLSDFVVKVGTETASDKAYEVSTEGNVHWYYITSASTKGYCKGKTIYYDSASGFLRFGDKAFSADGI